MKAALIAAVAGLALFSGVSAQKSSCPAMTVDGQKIPGSWHGYFLSSYPTSTYTTYFQASAEVDFVAAATGMTARVNLSNPVCTGGCPPHLKVDVQPCVATYNVNCLVADDPTVYAFQIDESNKPACLTSASDWVCKTRLTGTAYQDQGHNAAFFLRANYEPAIPGPPLHLEPFGTFETGCPSDNKASLQARLIQK